MAAAENLGVSFFTKIDCALPPWLKQAVRPAEVRQTKLGTFQRWELPGGSAKFVPGGKVVVSLSGSDRRSKSKVIPSDQIVLITRLVA